MPPPPIADGLCWLPWVPSSASCLGSPSLFSFAFQAGAPLGDFSKWSTASSTPHRYFAARSQGQASYLVASAALSKQSCSFHFPDVTRVLVPGSLKLQGIYVKLYKIFSWKSYHLALSFTFFPHGKLWGGHTIICQLFKKLSRYSPLNGRWNTVDWTSFIISEHVSKRSGTLFQKCRDLVTTALFMTFQAPDKWCTAVTLITFHTDHMAQWSHYTLITLGINGKK